MATRSGLVERLLERRLTLNDDGRIEVKQTGKGVKIKIPVPSMAPAAPTGLTVIHKRQDLDGDGVLSDIVSIRWDIAPKANFYEVEIANDTGGRKKFRTSTAVWDQIYSKRAGVLTIRVRAQDTYGNFSPWSSEVTFTPPARPREIVLDLDAEIFGGTDLHGRAEPNDRPKVEKVDANAGIPGYGRF